MEYIEYFKPSYSVIEHDPASTCGAWYDLKASGVSELAPAYELEIETARSAVWCAAVYGGTTELSRVLTIANPDALVCIARGVVYSIVVDRPADYSVLPIRAVRDTLCDEPSQRVLFIGWTSVLGLGAEPGDSWHARQLVSDGFTSYCTTDGRLVLRGFDAPSNADVEIALDVVTGEVVDRW